MEVKSNPLNAELPVGFGMALAQNESAMVNFSALALKQKQEVISRAKSMQSKTDMQRYVDEIATGVN